MKFFNSILTKLLAIYYFSILEFTKVDFIFKLLLEVSQIILRNLDAESLLCEIAILNSKIGQIFFVNIFFLLFFLFEYDVIWLQIANTQIRRLFDQTKQRNSFRNTSSINLCVNEWQSSSACVQKLIISHHSLASKFYTFLFIYVHSQMIMTYTI